MESSETYEVRPMNRWELAAVLDVSPDSPECDPVVVPVNREADERIAGLAQSAKLLAAFGGTVAGWSWDGSMIDTGPYSGAKCCCGHEVRYLFPWTHANGGQVCTGSTCVETVPTLGGAEHGAIVDRMHAAVAAAVAAQREAERKIRDARADEEIAALAERVKAALGGLRAEVRYLRDTGRWVPSGMFYTCREAGTAYVHARNLKSRPGQRKGLEKVAAAIENARRKPAA